MPPVTPQRRTKVIRALERAYGWSFEREGGNHTIYVKQGVPEPIAVPRHREISPGVIRTICKILNVGVSDFLDTLRKC
jgi:predicted RNA binding protein YcfA (HicA-like mRNA interferase family)